MKQLDPKAVWIFFVSFLLRWAFVFIWLIIFFGFIIFNPGTYAYVPSQLIVLAVLAVAALVIVSYVWARLSVHFYRYEVREDGFRKESGVIWKRYSTIPYGRIQNVDIYRGVIARILGLSDVRIETAGSSMPYGRNSWGATAEGHLPGLSQETAEQLRDELIRRSQNCRSNQGL